MAKILFVDDDPTTLSLMEKAANLLGHEAIIAQTAETALQAALDQYPDLILIDMGLQDTNGLSLLCTLRESATTSTIPILMISAGHSPNDEQAVCDAGADGFLPKPINLSELSDLIEHFVNRQTDSKLSNKNL